jgi:hypothetical protein
LTSKKLQDQLLRLRMIINTEASTKLSSMTMSARVKHYQQIELDEPEDEE